MSLCTIGIAVIVFHYAKFPNNDTANMPVQTVRLRLVFRLLSRTYPVLSYKGNPVQVFIEKEKKKKRTTRWWGDDLITERTFGHFGAFATRNLKNTAITFSMSAEQFFKMKFVIRTFY